MILVEGENYGGSIPTLENLANYASSKGFNGPVLADPNWGFAINFEKDNYIPTQVLIGRGLEVIKVDANIMPGDIDQALNAD